MVWVLSRLKRVIFAIQCENIIHARQLMLRHLMLYKTALGEGRVLYRLIFLTFSCLSCVPCSCGHFEQWLALTRPCPGPDPFLDQAGGPGHLAGTSQAPWECSEEKPQPALRLLHATWRHQTQSRQWSDSSVPSNVCLKSHLLKSAKRQRRARNLHGVCLPICCIPLYILVLSPFSHHRPSPWVEEQRENLTVFFPILDQVSWTFALWLPLNNPV